MWLSFAPVLTLTVLGIPIALGLAFTLMPAFGIFAAIGGTELSLDSWRALFSAPGFAIALILSLTTGLAATVISFVLAVGFCAMAAQSAFVQRLRRWLGPLLASPHSAMALGFAFLIMPSGWLVRFVSLFTGSTRPPAELVTVQDPSGIALIAGLLLKETPYLVLMILAASSQIPVRQILASARALGQRPAAAWLKAVFPQIYPQIRLPIFAVLAFSLSVVDVAMILGPGNPPPLAVMATLWFSDYDLDLYYPASAAAILQLLLVVACIALWWLAETPLAGVGRRLIERGGALKGQATVTMLAGAAAILVGGMGLASILGMALWSIAKTWRFPDILPTAWQMSLWLDRGGQILSTVVTTALIATLSTLISLALALGCLENEQRQGLRPGKTALWLLYMPLLVPQIAFLFGIQVLLIRLRLDGTLFAVVWAHMVFVLPYVFLSLADPFRALDPRFAASAAALGAKPLRIFLEVKLPLLARPILAGVAVGFAVSVGQYLPTLFAGAGRVSTLTTEAVTLASGGDRRVIGMVALLQSALPWAVYGLALLLPLLLFRKRGDLSR
ncbi:putative thiamine transport system permease protein [Rhodoligotrophos appendicifer]|uniref:ABC transporter permease n=1 Tax=Rhodoligotrophos appendicifer TaxID=987056 RepID=UPI001184E704|nr:ABC transporter permease subunit [Rhodoligotrophos appendicifer]